MAHIQLAVDLELAEHHSHRVVNGVQMTITFTTHDSPFTRRIAILLVLLAVGLGLLVWTAMTDGSRQSVLSTQYSVLSTASPSRSLQEILAQPDIIPTHHHPLVGRPAPDFELADTEGKVWKLAELRAGRPVVLIFYYGFHCIHCVLHLSDVKRDLPLFREVGARIVAISADPPAVTRHRFEQNGPFGFPVLSDPGNKAAIAYGAFRWAPDGKMPDMLRHGTFLIDQDGAVQWANVGDMPFRRNTALLYQLAKMTK